MFARRLAVLTGLSCIVICIPNSKWVPRRLISYHHESERWMQQPCCFVLDKNYVNKFARFSKPYYHRTFQDTILRVATLAPTLKVLVPAMLLLPIIENLKVLSLCALQLYDVHVKYHQNPPIRSRMDTCGRTDMHIAQRTHNNERRLRRWWTIIIS
jgi:hypothetical protein